MRSALCKLCAGLLMFAKWNGGRGKLKEKNTKVFEPEVNCDYTVETTDANGCVELSASYYFGTSRVSDHANAQGICAYPVPAQGLLTIVDAEAGAALLVYDMSGRQVASSTANAERTTFDLSTRQLRASRHREAGGSHPCDHRIARSELAEAPSVL